MNKTNVAVIGVGNMGRYHARVYSHLPSAHLVGVSDIDEERGRKVAEEFRCSYWKDLKDMLAEPSLEAVSVAVPTPFHAKVALEALNAGKHVLIEKPIALNVQEAELLIEVAQKHGLKLGVGHIERFNPAVQTLKRILEKGELGEITSLVTRRVGGLPQAKNGNVVIDLAVHDIDIYSYLLGKQPTSIYARGRRVLMPDQEDSAELMLSYGPVTGFIQVNWITPVKIRTLSVTGSKGFAELNYITQRLELYETNFTKDIDTFRDFVGKLGEPTRKEISVQMQEPLFLELESFIRSIQEDKDPEVGGREGKDALAIAEQALEMLRSNTLQ